MQEKNLSIQGLRAIAISMVFLSHTQSFLSSDLSFFSDWGEYGVYIFIAISGVLLAMNKDKYNYAGTWEEAISLAKKNIKKLYWLHVLLWGICVLSLTRGMSLIRIVIYSVFNLTLTQDFVPFSGIINSFNGPSWYLSMCMFLWLLTPKCVAAYCKKEGKRNVGGTLIAIAAISVLWQIAAEVFTDVVGENLPQINVTWFSSWLTYFCPVLCFLYFRFAFYMKEWLTTKNIKVKQCLLIILLLYLFEAFFINRFTMPYANTTMIVMAISVVVSTVADGIGGKWQEAALANKAIAYIGNISPYIFLIHGVVNMILRDYFILIGTPWLFGVSLGITLFLSSGVYFAVGYRKRNTCN